MISKKTRSVLVLVSLLVLIVAGVVSCATTQKAHNDPDVQIIVYSISEDGQTMPRDVRTTVLPRGAEYHDESDVRTIVLPRDVESHYDENSVILVFQRDGQSDDTKHGRTVAYFKREMSDTTRQAFITQMQESNAPQSIIDRLSDYIVGVTPEHPIWVTTFVTHIQFDCEDLTIDISCPIGGEKIKIRVPCTTDNEECQKCS